jgi:hypothetical protein
MTLKPQLFVLSKKVPISIRPVKNKQYPNKPRGGIWTSTYINPKKGSEWVQWGLENDYLPKKLHSWIVTPATNNIYEINSFKDLLDLWERYPFKVSINWESVAKQYDAVHLTKSGEQKTRNTSPINLYGWDMESTIWFKKVFSERYIGEVVYET